MEEMEDKEEAVNTEEIEGNVDMQKVPVIFISFKVFDLMAEMVDYLEDGKISIPFFAEFYRLHMGEIHREAA